MVRSKHVYTEDVVTSTPWPGICSKPVRSDLVTNDMDGQIDKYSWLQSSLVVCLRRCCAAFCRSLCPVTAQQLRGLQAKLFRRH